MVALIKDISVLTLIYFPDNLNSMFSEMWEQLKKHMTTEGMFHTKDSNSYPADFLYWNWKYN